VLVRIAVALEARVQDVRSLDITILGTGDKVAEAWREALSQHTRDVVTALDSLTRRFEA
jgi:hypothetical protein